MKPNGSTYVTVGSHGFYYRETLSPGGQPTTNKHVPNTAPRGAGASDGNATADVSQLVDSSSEALIANLNRRAAMQNPAWMLFALSVIALGTAFIIPESPKTTVLPSPQLSNSENNTRDQYSLIVARYGQPDAVVIQQPLTVVPVRIAKYARAGVDIIFVPSGCIEIYQRAKAVVPDVNGHKLIVKAQLEGIEPCTKPEDPAWTITGYVSSSDAPLSTGDAQSLLDDISGKRQSPPVIDLEKPSMAEQKFASRISRIKLPELKAEIRPNNQALATESALFQESEVGARNRRYEAFALITSAICLFTAGIFVHKRNSAKRVSRLFFELDETQSSRFAAVQHMTTHLSACHRVWRVEGESATADWKRNAGASRLVRRKPITIRNASPPRVEINVATPCINLGSAQMFFLPDLILYRERGTFGSIAYNDLTIVQRLTTFIEDEGVPGDANVIGSTWRYVNKNGGPDRRFNNNRQIPVVQYGVLTLSSSRGLNIHLNTSNPQASFAVVSSWEQISVRPEAKRSVPPRGACPATGPGARASALEVLELKTGASSEEITATYHRLAHMYHPDKVAGLGTEFQALADKRMKEINAAYRLLKGRPEGP